VNDSTSVPNNPQTNSCTVDLAAIQQVLLASQQRPQQDSCIAGPVISLPTAAGKRHHEHHCSQQP